MSYRSKWVRRLKRTGSLLMWIVLIVIVIRSLFFDIFHIPSDSMKNTLKENDLIITNKILYSSLLSKLLSPLDIKAHPKTNDILVFRISSNDHSLYVKRCIGLPGETIQIDSDHVFINGKVLPPPPTSRRLYKLIFHHYDTLMISLSKYKLGFNDIIQRYSNYIVIGLDNSQKDSLLHSAGVGTISLFKSDDRNKNSISTLIIPGYGKTLPPTLIPFKGMKIKLDSNAVVTYREMAARCEHISIEQKQGSFFVDKVKSDYYVFQKDYYFMMGDNRDNAVDSRSFGLIPKDYIEGRVIFTISR